MMRIFLLLKSHGLHGTLKKYSHEPQLYDEYPRWVALFDTITKQEFALMRTRMAGLSPMPLFSLLLLPGAARTQQARYTYESIQAQIYPRWEILTPGPEIEDINKALATATGEWIALIEPSCMIPPHALYLIAEELAAHPDAEIIYVDEDSISSEGVRCHPNFKPDWNPDLLLSHNYLGSLVFYRARLLREGFRVRERETMAWELALRLSCNLPPARILHVPYILCHQRTTPAPSPEAERRLLVEHLQRKGIHASIIHDHKGYWRIRHSLPARPPLVSIIIPTRNGLELLTQCIHSVRKKTAYAPFEIIVVDNQSDDAPTLEYLRQLERDKTARVLSHDAPFNYSAINNFAVSHARGEFLCLLNNDIEVIHSDWLEELVSQAARAETGAVGAMLYYPNGRIQHAGVLLKGEEVAAHFFARMPAALLATRPRAQIVQNLSAVTAACLLVEKKKFLEVGGFDENLAITCNDIDLCLKLMKAGYHNIWTPFAELYHHESATRGFDDSPSRQTRIRQERAYTYQRWAAILDHDPAYNPNLDLEMESYTLAFPPRTHKPWLMPATDKLRDAGA